MSVLLAVVITLLSFATTGGSDKHAVLKTQAVQNHYSGMLDNLRNDAIDNLVET